MDQDYDTLEEAAKATLEEAWEIYEAKAKYMIVGQVYYHGGYLDEEDLEKGRVVMGPFATRKQAESDGQKLAVSSATGEQAKWMAIPYWGGTPAAWYGERKKARGKQGSDDTPLRELRHLMQVEWLESHPGSVDLPKHLQGNGWDDLEGFGEWLEEHESQCSTCEGTGIRPQL